MSDSTEVKIHFLDYWRVVKSRWVIISIVFLLVLTTAGVTCFFLPREYPATVKMEVQQKSGLSVFSNDPMRSVNDPKFVTTQFEIMQSKEILYPVIEELELTKKWKDGNRFMGREEIYNTLRRPSTLQMREVRNTDLIEMIVWSRDREEGPLIANTIASVYQTKRRMDQETQLKRGLRELSEEVEKQRRHVEESAQKVALIRSEQGIVDLNPETLDTPETIDKPMVLQDQTRAEENRAEVIRLKAQLEQIRTLKPEELMVAMRTLQLEDMTVMKVLPLYQDAVAEEARLLSAGLGRKHPKIRSLVAQKEVYTSQLNDATTALRSSLETRLRIAEGNLASIEQKLAQSKEEFIQGKKQGNEYIQAKSNYIQAKRILEAAEQKLFTEQIQQRISYDPAKIWEKAEPAPGPGRPRVLFIMAAATGFGLILGIAVAFFIEYLDTSVKTLDDVERFLGVPVLAVIPTNVQLLHLHAGDSPDAEAYRILRTNFEFNRKDPSQNSLTLISGGPGEGKSTTLCNLAYTCAKGGYNVLVVDADLRRPSQHRLWNVDNRRGLTDYLTGQADWQDVVVKLPYENVSFIPSGKLPEDAVGILNSQRMVELIQTAKRRYDLVFFDSPPILGVSDGSVLVSEVDLTMMVIQHRRFPRAMLQRVKAAVMNVGGTLIGAVLNNVDTKQDQGYQYYTSYQDYYNPQRDRKEAAKHAAETRQGLTNGAPRTPIPSRPASSDDEDQY